MDTRYTRQEEVATERLAVSTEHRKVRLVATNLKHKLDTLGRPRSVTERAYRDELLRTISDLEGEGLPRQMGVSFDDVVSLVGKPGLAALQRRLDELDAEQARLEASLLRWPTPDTTHPYRYTGAADAHLHFDGAAHRYLEPGEVIALTEEQATAFSDRFEPADAPTPTDASSEEPVAVS